MSTVHTYGIDTENELTPLDIRNAILECFYQVYCADSQLEEEGEEGHKFYCGTLVEKAFAESEGDLEYPTKETLLQGIEKLAVFSKHFRHPEVIGKHKSEIAQLINKLS